MKLGILLVFGGVIGLTAGYLTKSPTVGVVMFGIFAVLKSRRVLKPNAENHGR